MAIPLMLKCACNLVKKDKNRNKQRRHHHMYKLKSILRRSLLALTAAIVATAGFLPAALTHADALNPLTDRSLTLSSSSPGWDYTDGSGNATYAPPNSGANGKETGNTFAFNVSTDSSASGTNEPIKAFTLQYCTEAAGTCTAPGNDATTGTSPSIVRSPDSDAAHQTDLNVASTSPSEVTPAAFTSLFNTSLGTATGIPAADNSQGNYVVLTKDIGAGAWTQSTGWSMTVSNNEDSQTVGEGGTGKNNFITLTNSTGGLALKSGGAVKIIFFATDTNYVTNPGAGAFFVKINDYNSATTLDDTTLTDGGVTVANVVNQSIEIQTKVLETMDFSVGTVDPDSLSSTGGATSQLHAANGTDSHGQCDSILPQLTSAGAATNDNVLQMGDTAAENALSTAHTYSTHSYWRLSSNSSAGATVYYSGETLSNTEGDQIAAIGKTAEQPHVGTPQFGLSLDNGSGPTYAVDYNTEENPVTGDFENGADAGSGVTQGVDPTTTTDTSADLDYHAPSLYPMAPETASSVPSSPTDYSGGTNDIVNSEYGTVGSTFAFDANSNVAPVPLASDAGKVVDCVTAKVRYIANIAATTPAGIYTTKINYIAAPQY